MSYRCALHPDTGITHFCQSCMDLVCEKCITKQPHSGSSHKIKQIAESANIRKNLYADYIQKQVNSIRSQCHKKISYLQNIKKQIERDKKVIQKDIKIQFQAINNKLEDKKSQAIIIKQTEIKHLQNYIHIFDDITSAFDSIYQNPQGVLISYKTLDIQLRRLEALRSNLMKDLHQDKQIQLSRQFQITLQQSLTLQQYKDCNQFMNKLIAQYVQNYKKVLKQTAQTGTKQVKISKHTYNQTFLQTVKDQTAKLCAFCGFPFTLDYVNQQCANNRTFKMNCIYSDKDWQNIIPQDIRGTKRHYWITSQIGHRKKPKLQQHSLIRKTIKKHYWNSLLQLQSVKHILKRHEIENDQQFGDLVKQNDPGKTGYISKIAFIYNLSKVYMLPKQQIESLIMLLEEEKGINYQKFIELLNQPTADYHKFVAQEDDIQKKKPTAPQSGYSKYKY